MKYFVEEVLRTRRVAPTIEGRKIMLTNMAAPVEQEPKQAKKLPPEKKPDYIVKRLKDYL